MVSDAESKATIEAQIWQSLREVNDPEVGMNIVDLGLVYSVTVEGDLATVRLTMTTPACPLGDEILEHVEERLFATQGVARVDTELVWDPPWEPSRMSAGARKLLGWDE